MTFSFIEQIIFLAFLILTVGYFAWAIFSRIRIVLKGKPDSVHEPVAKRVARFILEVLFQSKVIKDRPVAGLLHALVFWGFLAYALATINHFMLPFKMGFLVGEFGSFYRAFVFGVSVLVLVSILALGFRRFILKPAYFEKKLSVTSGIVVALIAILMITYMLVPYLPDGGLAGKANWWIHSSSILIFLIVIPQSKHLHLVLGPFNLIYMREHYGYLPALNIEELTEESVLGVGSAAHLSREMRLDAFSCVECGRCTEMCPANQSDKILDPRSMIHSYEQPLLTGSESDAFDGIIKSEAVWQCVTCGACESVCPLGIQHLPLILQMRRHLTLEKATLPQQMQNTFKSLQTKKNVWNAATEERAERIEELGLPAHQKGQILIWSSCFFFTDSFMPKIQRFVQLLQKAGVEAGISPNEACCGDPARKCGGEDLFQELAMENIQWMKEQEVKTVVSHCPHCLQTIKDGYRQVDPEFEVEVIHHSELLSKLMNQGKLKSIEQANARVTIHDPCYVSRWNFGDIEGLRNLAGGSRMAVEEMTYSHSKSFCCGSGGGSHHYFEDEDLKRIDITRMKQIVATGAETVITACPFCHNMVSEGLKQEDSNMKVADISELLEI